MHHAASGTAGPQADEGTRALFRRVSTITFLCGISLLAGLVVKVQAWNLPKCLDPELVCGARCGAASRPVAGS